MFTRQRKKSWYVVLKKLAPISNLKMFTIQRKKSWWYASHTLFVAHHHIRCISNHCYTPQRQIARNFRDLYQTTTKRRYSLALCCKWEDACCIVGRSSCKWEDSCCIVGGSMAPATHVSASRNLAAILQCVFCAVARVCNNIAVIMITGMIMDFDR